MKLFSKLSLALCLTLSAQSAHALNHEIFITKEGYFPETIYISTPFTGVTDTITFKNVSGYNASLETSSQQRVCSRWSCYWKTITTTFMSVSSGGTATYSMDSTLGTLISSSSSTLPKVKFTSGYSSWYASNDADVSYDMAPSKCPDSRSLCDPTFVNGSDKPE